MSTMSTRKSSRLSLRSAPESEGAEESRTVNGEVKSLKQSTKANTSKKVAAQKVDASTIHPEAPAQKTAAQKRKLSETATTSNDQTNSTQTPKKRSTKADMPSSETPTSAAVTPKPKKSRPRVIDPQATNAPLQTPGGSRVVKSYPSDLFEMTPKTAAKADVTTTDNLLDRACAHLCSVEPSLKVVIEKHPCAIFSPEGLQEEVNPFNSLCSSIISQQVSGAAAASIKRKFVSLFPEPNVPSLKHFPTPSQVAAMDLPTLRTAGLSQRKAEYIQGLAEKFASGELSSRMLVDASDEELLEKLIAVRGLGRWSVEMFACFALKRMDIFSTGDLGVQRGMAVFVGKDVSKLKAKGGKWKYMTEKEMLEIANQFVPYRSLFMWYMWRVEDVNIGALQAN